MSLPEIGTKVYVRVTLVTAAETGGVYSETSFSALQPAARRRSNSDRRIARLGAARCSRWPARRRDLGCAGRAGPALESQLVATTCSQGAASLCDCDWPSSGKYGL